MHSIWYTAFSEVHDTHLSALTTVVITVTAYIAINIT
jgi:hypothetical protein